MKITNIYKRLIVAGLIATLLFSDCAMSISAASAKNTTVKKEGEYKYRLASDEKTAVIVKYIGKKKK